MKEKVLELLVFLMSEIRDNKALSDIDVNGLRSQGYTQAEISDAFSWLYEHAPAGFDAPHRPTDAMRGSRRMFHDAEKLVLSTEGQGYLILLTELGLLRDQDLELVIERAMMAGYERLSVAELRQMAASVLFGRRAGDAGTHRAQLDDGNTVH